MVEKLLAQRIHFIFQHNFLDDEKIKWFQQSWQIICNPRYTTFETDITNNENNVKRQIDSSPSKNIKRSRVLSEIPVIEVKETNEQISDNSECLKETKEISQSCPSNISTSFCQIQKSTTKIQSSCPTTIKKSPVIIIHREEEMHCALPHINSPTYQQGESNQTSFILNSSNSNISLQESTSQKSIERRKIAPQIREYSPEFSHTAISSPSRNDLSFKDPKRLCRLFSLDPDHVYDFNLFYVLLF